MLLIWWSLTGLPLSNNFIQTMLSRQKTWWIFPCLYRSLHLPQINLYYGQRDTETKALLVTFKCPKFLPLIHFLSFIFNIASAYLQLTNLTITLLPCSHDIYLGIPWERVSVTALNVSSIHIYSRLLADVNNTVFSKSSSQILVGMPDNSTLFLWLYCSPFAWYFSS